MHYKIIRITAILAFSIGSSSTYCAAEVPSKGVLDWTLRFGGQRTDEANGIAADSNGFIYVAGSLDDGPSDGFLRKIDSDGGFHWQYRFGANGIDKGLDVSVDLADNPLVAGYTEGSIGGTNAGGTDSLVLKVDSSGDQLWANQIGTTGNDTAYGVVPDPFGNIYVSGTSNLLDPRMYLRKFDADGNILWSRGAGTSQRSTGLSVASDAAGNAYVTGWVSPSVNPDVLLLKYNPSGNLEWTRRLITNESDVALEVAVDGLGGIYVTGSTGGSLFASNSSAGQDVFLAKYDSDGNPLWNDQFGASSSDVGRGLAFGVNGDVYLAGSGVGAGLPNTAGSQIFLRRYSSDGDLQWASAFLTGTRLEVLDLISLDRRDFYIAGRIQETEGGHYDAVVYKITEIPEPTSAVLMIGMVVVLICFCRTAQLRLHRS